MVVDIIILAVIVLSGFIGMKKGFTVCVVNLLAVIIALVLALLFCKPLANVIIQNTEIDENLQTTIASGLPMNGEEIAVDANTNLPEGIKNYLTNTANSLNDAKNNTIESVSRTLAEEVIIVVSFIIIFVVARAVLLVVKVVSKVVNKLPILKQLDKAGGFVVGLIEGLLFVYSVLAILSICAPVFSNTPILEAINNSFAGKIMYNNNIVLNKLYNK